MIQFSEHELEQYKRHLSLNEIGYAGQQKLKHAKVLCVGAGGLGSPALFYLAAAGVGTLGIIDNDKIERSNLQRQILFTAHDAGQNKAITAKKRLAALNPHITINAYEQRLTSENAANILSQYDIIADGSDNFETRYLVNHTCVALQKVNVSASVFGFKGQCTLIEPSSGPCYNCLYPAGYGESSLLNCSDNGILGVLPGIIGSIQANEIIKWILCVGTSLFGKLLQFDALTLSFSIFSYNKVLQCEICGNKKLPPFFYKKSSLCQKEFTLTWQEFLAIRNNENIFLIDVRTPQEHSAYNLGGINIPLPQLAGNLGSIAKDKLIIVYCQSGQRSAAAVGILNKFGFLRVKNLEGGIR